MCEDSAKSDTHCEATDEDYSRSGDEWNTAKLIAPKAIQPKLNSAAIDKGRIKCGKSVIEVVVIALPLPITMCTTDHGGRSKND